MTPCGTLGVRSRDVLRRPQFCSITSCQEANMFVEEENGLNEVDVVAASPIVWQACSANGKETAMVEGM